MVTVKIECECGQHYAFDVEPVNGQMASTVGCPTCGADGTAAANAIIASQQPQPFSPPPIAASPTPPPFSGARLAVAHSEQESPAMPAKPAAVKRDVRLGLVDPETAKNEARAKMSWGEPQEDVTRYLMLQGFSAEEASDYVADLYKERLAALRAKGVRKIFAGFGMMCVPVLALLPMLHYKVISFQILAVPVLIGLYGCWQVLNGIITLAAPKMESGDVAE